MSARVFLEVPGSALSGSLLSIEYLRSTTRPCPNWVRIAFHMTTLIHPKSNEPTNARLRKHGQFRTPFMSVYVLNSKDGWSWFDRWFPLCPHSILCGASVQSLCSWYRTSSFLENGIDIPSFSFPFTIILFSAVCLHMEISYVLHFLLFYYQCFTKRFVIRERRPSLLLMVGLRSYYSTEDLVLLIFSKRDVHPVYSNRLASRMRGCSIWRLDRCANKLFLHWVYVC